MLPLRKDTALARRRLWKTDSQEWYSVRGIRIRWWREKASEFCRMPEKLKTAGPVMESRQCRRENRIFFPLYNLRHALCHHEICDDGRLGKIACATGDSRWVTGETARRHVHKTRRAVSGIMAGIGTVLSDDPMLNCRLKEDPVNPVRIICDSRLRIPEDSQIIRTAREIPTIIAYVPDKGGKTALAKRAARLAGSGAEPVPVDADDSGRIDLQKLMKILGERKIDSILLEGGSELNFSAMKAGIFVPRIQVYLAPKIVGGADAKTPVGGAGIGRMADAVLLSLPKMTSLGQDILLEYDVLQPDAAEKEQRERKDDGCLPES